MLLCTKYYVPLPKPLPFSTLRGRFQVLTVRLCIVIILFVAATTVDDNGSMAKERRRQQQQGRCTKHEGNFRHPSTYHPVVCRKYLSWKGLWYQSNKTSRAVGQYSMECIRPLLLLVMMMEGSRGVFCRVDSSCTGGGVVMDG